MTDGADAGNTVYFTTNGSTPTTASMIFSNPPCCVASNGPIIVSSTMTIKAIAVASGFTNSAVGNGGLHHQLINHYLREDEGSRGDCPGPFYVDRTFSSSGTR